MSFHHRYEKSATSWFDRVFTRASMSGYALFLLILCNTIHSISSTCQSSGWLTWNPVPRNVTVEWQVDKVCASYKSCYGIDDSSQSNISQLCPLEIQEGDAVFLSKGPLQFSNSLSPINVTQSQWSSCSQRDGQSVLDSTFAGRTSSFVKVHSQFLIPGSHYFAQDNNFCFFGLRINVTVKPKSCTPEGLSVEDCSGFGKCVTRPLESTYTCLCESEYSGPYCQEYNACIAEPCLNAGNCTDILNGTSRFGFICDCLDGFTGSVCEEVVGVCSDSVCNNGTCEARTVNSFVCRCNEGYTGTFCTEWKTYCQPGLCQNGSTCEDQFGNYTCHCAPGYQGNGCTVSVATGRHCEVDIDDCASSPCAVNSSCIDLVNDYSCSCLPGYTGKNCSQMVNYCLSSPCENEGTCVPKVRGYTCQCLAAYTGTRCQSFTNRCTNDTCINGGVCVISLQGVLTCQCPPGWTGDRCSEVDYYCQYDPCSTSATCVDILEPSGQPTFKCVCLPGYTGANCNVDIDECLSSPCLNNGTCSQGLNIYNCSCPLGYEGDRCEVNIDVCQGLAVGVCQNGATCVDGDIGLQFTCKCAEGFEGNNCSVNIDECQSQPCQNGATCVDGVNGYNCSCPQGFFGRHCESDVDYCQVLKVCKNGATCTPVLDLYECHCAAGWTGVNCTENVDECGSSPCQNGSTCHDLVNGFRCDCMTGFEGTVCDINIDDCSREPCLNNATCVDLVAGYTCQCLPGYTGYNCSVDLNECSCNPCQNGGKCIDEVNQYVCQCNSALFGGVNCEIPLNNCSFSPCQHNSTCTPVGSTQYTCSCSERYTGKNCESYIPQCNSTTCLNNGTCQDFEAYQNFTCHCADGFTGSLCETDIDYCSSNNCTNNSTCEDGLQNYTCQCLQGFTGELCEVDINECESNPCLNKALCVDKVNGYQCYCVDGYTGDHCGINFDECSASPCQNNGTCTDLVANYSCTCLDGFEGQNCSINIDDCVTVPCANNATCEDLVADYRCHCQPGFEGRNCSINVDDCASNPCDVNGTRECVDGIDTYTCVCQPGFTGLNCSINSDECVRHNCSNNASCVDLINGFRCDCLAGYTGRYCEVNIDDCSSNPCNNSAVCVDGVQSYSCLCPNDTRLYDTHCNFISRCLSNPCQNNASCVDTAGFYGWQCQCVPGYEGVTCEREIDECASPSLICQNGGTCHDRLNGFQCSCPAGFEGDLCQINVDDCAGNLCAENSTCVDGVQTYTCLCAGGIVGSYCNITARSCSDSPCKNNAFCLPVPSETNSYTCFCQPGYTGTYCELEQNECLSNPCRNNASCTDVFNGFTCSCLSGFTGVTCGIDIDDCVSSLCTNGSTCVDLVNGYKCNCPPGFTGVYCEVNIDECQSDPCQNGGICVDGINGYTCFCRNGFKGNNCEVNKDDCASSPCKNNAACIDGVAVFTCQCLPGFTGVMCEANIDDCESVSCQHGANCTDLVNDFRCGCIPGYTGKYCETDIDECASSPCQNGGSCRDAINKFICDCPYPYRGANCSLLPCDELPCEQGGTCTLDLTRVDGFVCSCPSGFAGNRCQRNINDCPGNCTNGFCVDGIDSYLCQCQPGWDGPDCDRPVDDCQGNNCKNGATCIDLVLAYRCQCSSGWEGNFCEQDVDDCASSPCANGGRCEDLLNDYKCECTAGWTSKNCSQPINECESNPCLNNATCVDDQANFTCRCAPFYTGRLCETRYDPCSVGYNQCRNNATCATHTNGSYSCGCVRGFTGFNCELNINECGSSPCQHNSTCEDLVDDYSCHCMPGYEGKNCETDIDECLPEPCVNAATCVDDVNRYTCQCARGYRGVNCSLDIDECQLSPCQNGAACLNSVGSYRCQCVPGYTGSNCSVDINECASDPCQNEASCLDQVNTYFCQCPVGFSGVDCEKNIDDCASQPCVNGNCTDLVASYQCVCDPGWTGQHCEVNVDECSSSPCHNGGTCDDQVNGFKCTCLDGYSGVFCDIDISVCQSGNVSQCQNGGVCQDGPGNKFNCSCLPGFTGLLCETDIDDCSPNLCQSLSTCQDGINNYTCLCLPGWTGRHCESDINECEPNPCLNEGLCRQMAPGAGFECLCRGGLYYGDRCQFYDDCNPEPRCQNGGTCIDGTNTFTCNCPAWFGGSLCEINLNTTTTSSPVTPSETSFTLPASMPVTSHVVNSFSQGLASSPSRTVDVTSITVSLASQVLSSVTDLTSTVKLTSTVALTLSRSYVDLTSSGLSTESTFTKSVDLTLTELPVDLTSTRSTVDLTSGSTVNLTPTVPRVDLTSRGSTVDLTSSVSTVDLTPTASVVNLTSSSTIQVTSISSSRPSIESFSSVAMTSSSSSSSSSGTSGFSVVLNSSLTNQVSVDLTSSVGRPSVVTSSFDVVDLTSTTSKTRVELTTARSTDVASSTSAVLVESSSSSTVSSVVGTGVVLNLTSSVRELVTASDNLPTFTVSDVVTSGELYTGSVDSSSTMGIASTVAPSASSSGDLIDSSPTLTALSASSTVTSPLTLISSSVLDTSLVVSSLSGVVVPPSSSGTGDTSLHSTGTDSLSTTHTTALSSSPGLSPSVRTTTTVLTSKSPSSRITESPGISPTPALSTATASQRTGLEVTSLSSSYSRLQGSSVSSLAPTEGSFVIQPSLSTVTASMRFTKSTDVLVSSKNSSSIADVATLSSSLLDLPTSTSVVGKTLSPIEISSLQSQSPSVEASSQVSFADTSFTSVVKMTTSFTVSPDSSSPISSTSLEFTSRLLSTPVSSVEATTSQSLTITNLASTLTQVASRGSASFTDKVLPSSGAYDPMTLSPLQSIVSSTQASPLPSVLVTSQEPKTVSTTSLPISSSPVTVHSVITKLLTSQLPLTLQTEDLNTSVASSYSSPRVLSSSTKSVATQLSSLKTEFMATFTADSYSSAASVSNSSPVDMTGLASTQPLSTVIPEDLSTPVQGSYSSAMSSSSSVGTAPSIASKSSSQVTDNFIATTVSFYHSSAVSTVTTQSAEPQLSSLSTDGDTYSSSLKPSPSPGALLNTSSVPGRTQARTALNTGVTTLSASQSSVSLSSVKNVTSYAISSPALETSTSIAQSTILKSSFDISLLTLGPSQSTATLSLSTDHVDSFAPETQSRSPETPSINTEGLSKLIQSGTSVSVSSLETNLTSTALSGVVNTSLLIIASAIESSSNLTFSTFMRETSVHQSRLMSLHKTISTIDVFSITSSAEVVQASSPESRLLTSQSDRVSMPSIQSSPTSLLLSATDLVPTATPASTVEPSSSVLSTTTPTPPQSCAESPCMNQATCVDILGSQPAYRCLCTFQYQGARCETARNIQFPQYVGDTYLEYPGVTPGVDTGDALTLSLSINTTQDGSIFYVAKDYAVTDSTHFMQLLVIDGVLKYRYSCVIAEYELNSGVTVNTGNVFHIHLSQSKDCRARLEVTGAPAVQTGQALFFSHFNTLSSLYFGGLPAGVSALPYAQPFTSFTGCIGNITLNGKRLEFMDATNGSRLNECGYAPSPTTTSAPTSLPTTAPPTCQDVTCQNGGTCRNVLDGQQALFTCDCPLHFTGSLCEREIVVYFPYFNGHSYLQHNNLSVFGSTQLFITFKTSTTDGTILYTHSPSTPDIYIQLYVEGGLLKCKLACTADIVLNVNTFVNVSHNNLTAVSIRQVRPLPTTRGQCSVSVTVDTNSEVSSSAVVTSPQQLTNGPVYLGGLPKGVTAANSASPLLNYDGCIRQLQVDTKEVDVFMDAVAGQNIAECSVPACSYEPCQNNGSCLLDGESWFCRCYGNFTGALCERRVCERNPCMHGGTCVEIGSTELKYACLCPYGRHGVNCSEAVVITRPSFAGNHYGYSSYLMYPQVIGMNFLFSVRLKVILPNNGTSLRDGLILFTGQRGQNPFGDDLVVLGIQNGHVVFKFDLGSGTVIIRSPRPLNTSLPVHSVEFGRNNRLGWLKVNDQLNMTGQSPCCLLGLNLQSDLYVGGHEMFDLRLLPPAVNFSNGFQGCLYDLEVKTGSEGVFTAPGQPMGKVEAGRNIQQCKVRECDLNPCSNGGVCVDLGSSFFCNCTEPWKGELCTEASTVCDSQHDCAAGAVCVPLSQGGYTCDCPLGRTGPRCQRNVRLSDVRFVGENSYMSFRPRNIRKWFNIRLQFQPDKMEGLLFYVAQHLNERSGDFLSITLSGGHVEMRFNLGSYPTVVIRSQQAVENSSGTWNVLEVGKDAKTSYLSLNGQNVSQVNTAGMVSLDTTTHFYLGGLPSLDQLPKYAVENEAVTFEGCVRELVVNGHSYELTMQEATGGLNVVDCDGTTCGYSVCKNGGNCTIGGNGQFSCFCTSMFYGETCSVSIYCKGHQCANGALCIPDVQAQNYSCGCGLGWAGQFCNRSIQFSWARLQSPYSYLHWMNADHSLTNRTVTYIAFNFSTISSDGLIFWNGQLYQEDDDYLGVGVQGGHLYLVWNLGWTSREILITPAFVNDGSWHAVIIERLSKDLVLYLDGDKHTSQVTGKFQALNSRGAFYLGGFGYGRDIQTETFGKFSRPFQGCVRDVRINSESNSFNLQQADEGMNIDSCN